MRRIGVVVLDPAEVNGVVIGDKVRHGGRRGRRRIRAHRAAASRRFYATGGQKGEQRKE
jgi:hypothetical protein